EIEQPLTVREADGEPPFLEHLPLVEIGEPALFVVAPPEDVAGVGGPPPGMDPLPDQRPVPIGSDRHVEPLGTSVLELDGGAGGVTIHGGHGRALAVDTVGNPSP